MENDYGKLFKPDELPSEVTFDMVIYYNIAGWLAGSIGVYEFGFKGDENKVLLGTQRVTFKIPEHDHDGIRSKALDALQEKKQTILAENHARLKDIQDKIDCLLAIEHHKE